MKTILTTFLVSAFVTVSYPQVSSKLIGKWEAVSNYSNDNKQSKAIDPNSGSYSSYEFMSDMTVKIMYGTDQISRAGTWNVEGDTLFLNQVAYNDVVYDDKLVIGKLNKKLLRLLVIDGDEVYGYDEFRKVPEAN